MSEMNDESTSMALLAKRQWAAGFIGIVGTILWIVGYMAQSDHSQAMYGYLFAFVFWVSMTIGCLGMLIIQGTLKTSWGISIVRILEAGASPSMLVLLLVMFLPIAMPGVGLGILYKWVDVNYMSADPVLRAKEWYLTAGGFFWRAIVVGIFWAIWSFFLKRSSLRQDKSLDPGSGASVPASGRRESSCSSSPFRLFPPTG